MKHPEWFIFKVDFFLAATVSNINEQLIEHNIDAKNVISIISSEASGFENGYQVFYRRRVENNLV